MSSGTFHPPKLAGTPDLIFRWRRMRQPLVPKLLALVIAVAFFSLLMSVRVRLNTPEKAISRRGSVIYLGDDAESRSLALQAREGGPFPSSFQLSEWDGLAEIEAAAVDAVRFQPLPYVPALQELPSENQLQPLELAAKGKSFFPQQVPADVKPPDVTQLKLAPVIYPLSGTPADAIPAELPPFTGAVDDTTATDPGRFPPWRFLVRVEPHGGVAECVSLEKGGQPGAPELEAWLHRVQFKPGPGKPSRWIAVGIGFTNQPADEPDAR